MAIEPVSLARNRAIHKSQKSRALKYKLFQDFLFIFFSNLARAGSD